MADDTANHGQAENGLLNRLAKWIGSLTALILAVVGLRAAAQQLFPPSPPKLVTRFGSDGGPAAAAYVIPDSDSRRLTAADLTGLSTVQLGLARNEIFARHGWLFQTKDLRDYFSGKSWYTPAAGNGGIKLSSIESDNVALIKQFETEKGG